MALDADRLANAIVDALDSAGKFDSSLDKAEAKAESLDTFKLVAEEIVSEFVDNAELDGVADTGISVTVDPSTGNGSTTQDGPLSGGIE